MCFFVIFFWYNILIFNSVLRLPSVVSMVCWTEGEVSSSRSRRSPVHRCSSSRLICLSTSRSVSCRIELELKLTLLYLLFNGFFSFIKASLLTCVRTLVVKLSHNASSTIGKCWAAIQLTLSPRPDKCSTRSESERVSRRVSQMSNNTSTNSK